MDPLGAGGGQQVALGLGGTGGGGAGGADDDGAGAAGIARDDGGDVGGTSAPLGIDPPSVGSSCSPISLEPGVLNPCGQAWAVAYSPDGQLLASGGPDGKVHLWRTTDGTPVLEIRAHDGSCADVAFSPDGKLLASAGNSGSSSVAGSGMVNVWDAGSGTLVRSFPISTSSGSINYGSSASFSHDGKLLATSGVANIEIWRVADGTRATSISATGTTYQVRFSPDDSMLIAAGTNGSQARVFKVSTGKLVFGSLSAASDQASGDFSPSGKLIATNGPDGTVKVWDASSGALLQTMSGHIFMMGRVVWVDDNRLLSDDWNGLVILWTRDGSGNFARTRSWLAGTPLTSLADSINMAVSPDKTRFAVGGLVNGQGGFVFFAL